MNDLSPFEQKVLILLRSMDPFQVLEIKREMNRFDLSLKSTLRESFPADRE